MNEAELLFTRILNCDRLSLHLKKDMLLDKNKSALVSAVLIRRFRGEPLQYILGKIEFMGLELKVNDKVFIPRPETEILVETAIKQLSVVPCLPAGRSCQLSDIKIIDLCTGSGCIAVSLAKLIPAAKITATDISEKALEVAKSNAELNHVAEKIKFIKSDLFKTQDLQLATYDLIISNPPYVPREVIEILQPEVKSEPRVALDGGPDGLDFYRRIIKEAPAYLKTGGLLLMEMGAAQGQAIKEIFELSGKFEIIEIVLDYNNLERVIVARNHG